MIPQTPPEHRSSRSTVKQSPHLPPEQAGGQLRHRGPCGPRGYGGAEPARWLMGLSRNDLTSSAWCTPEHRAPLTIQHIQSQSLPTHLMSVIPIEIPSGALE